MSNQALIYSYIFTFATLLTIMSNVCQYFYMHRPKKSDFWGKNGPTLLMALATTLQLLSPLKELVVKVCMLSFQLSGFDSTIEHALDVAYLPYFGTRHMQAYTVFAYAAMFYATALQVDVGSKFFSLLQQQRAKQKAAAAAAAAVACPAPAKEHLS